MDDGYFWHPYDGDGLVLEWFGEIFFFMALYCFEFTICIVLDPELLVCNATFWIISNFLFLTILKHNFFGLAKRILLP